MKLRRSLGMEKAILGIDRLYEDEIVQVNRRKTGTEAAPAYICSAR